MQRLTTYTSFLQFSQFPFFCSFKLLLQKLTFTMVKYSSGFPVSLFNKFRASVEPKKDPERFWQTEESEITADFKARRQFQHLDITYNFRLRSPNL